MKFKKLIPVLVMLSLLLVSCNLFSQKTAAQPLSDAEMATRVAELLSTMTTPTSEIVFPATSTPAVALPTIKPSSTALTAAQMIVTLAPTVAPTSDFSVTQAVPQETVAISPTATATFLPSDPASSLGVASSSDAMSDSTTWGWPVGSDDFVDVQFAEGYLLMTNLSKTGAGWRLPMVSQQKDSYLEVTVNSAACTEKDSYGIIFRVPVFKEPDQGYLYQVTCDGYYRLWKWDGKSGANGLAVSLIPWKQSGAINVGGNQTNRLGVMVVGDSIKIYLNGVALGEVKDSTYSAGFFGVFVRSGGSTNYTAKFDSMRFWENPGE